MFSSPTVASLAYYFARQKPSEYLTLRVIQDQISLSRVALRHGLHTLVEASLIREDKSGKSSIYHVADPERLASLAAYVERSDPDLVMVNEPSGLLWASALVGKPDQRRRIVPVGLHDPLAKRDLTVILPDNPIADELPATPRLRPREESRRARQVQP